MNYIERVVSDHKAQEINTLAKVLVVNPLVSKIEQWAGECLNEIQYSGSYAKGTALDSTSDLDLFVSLKSTTDNTLSEIYESLKNYLAREYTFTRNQNVSVRVSTMGYDIDVVPAKRNPGNTNMHKLYTSKKGSWIQTDVRKHINLIGKSNRVTEISALKVWRENHELKFPSILIELMSIQALKGRLIGAHEENFLYLLDYMYKNIETIRVVDPANSNNVISDSIYKYEKTAIKRVAKESLQKKYWSEILW